MRLPYLGDTFATLLAEHFTFQGNRHLYADECTKFIVLFHGSPRDELVQYIGKRLRKLGQLPFEVALSTFSEEANLESQLSQQIDAAITNPQLPLK